MDAWATIAQAQGVLMELLHVDAVDARAAWLTSAADQRGQSLVELAAEVEHRMI